MRIELAGKGPGKCFFCQTCQFLWLTNIFWWDSEKKVFYIFQSTLLGAHVDMNFTPKGSCVDSTDQPLSPGNSCIQSRKLLPQGKGMPSTFWAEAHAVIPIADCAFVYKNGHNVLWLERCPKSWPSHFECPYHPVVFWISNHRSTFLASLNGHLLMSIIFQFIGFLLGS